MTMTEDILDLSRQRALGPLSPWFSRQLDVQVRAGRFLPDERLEQVGRAIVDRLAAYREQASVGTAVLGMSGGVDSALTAALFRTAGWRVVGYMLPIEQDPEETSRGVEACEALGLEHATLDLSEQYRSMVAALGGLDPDLARGDGKAARIRKGNVRARLRMITLYDQAHRHGGVVASTDNYSELGAGFWTLHGDVGDLAPVQGLLKSWEVPWMARAYGVPERTWRATPTDGLGIDAGDEAQIGATYLEWDLMVFAMQDALPGRGTATPEEIGEALGVSGDDRAATVFANTLARLRTTWHKRLNPIRFDHPAADRYGPLDRLDAAMFRPAVLR